MKIAITGIKSLKETTQPIEINKLSVITGQNSSGKTSFTLGLKLLSQNFKNISYKHTFELFESRLDPRIINPSLSIKSLSNNQNLKYKIYFGNNDLEQIELTWKAFDNSFQLHEITYLYDSKIVLVKTKTATKNTEERIDSDFNNDYFIVNLLLGNYGEEHFDSLKKAICLLIELRKDKKFIVIENDYKTKGYFTSNDESILDSCINEILKKDLYITKNDFKSLKELTLNCGNKFPKSEDLPVLLSFIENRAIRKDVLLELGLENDAEVIEEIIKLINREDASDYGVQSTLRDFDSEKDHFAMDFAFYLSTKNKLPETTKYFIKSEGYYESSTEYYDPESNKLESLDFASISKDQFLYRLILIAFDNIEYRILNQLNYIKDIQFETDLLLEQKEYFLSSENSTFFNVSKFFHDLKFNNQVEYHEYMKLINRYCNMLQIGSNISIEEHLHGNAYMIFVTNNYGEKVNIGTLGSGHYYLLKLLLVLFQKLQDRNQFLLKNHLIDLESNIQVEDRKVIVMVLTEPEANLHPNLQSLLCDFLVKITKHFNVKFVVETHSEYLIRNLQLNVAQKNIQNDECKLYFFENNNGSTQIRRIRIDKKGFLMDKFGSGFLDESQKKIEELFKVKQN